MSFKVLEHRTILSEEGRFFGWPANHGLWQKGEEVEVGVLEGAYSNDGTYHNIEPPFLRPHLKTSDGGKSWRLEYQNVKFETQRGILPFEGFHKDHDVRVCGNYDTGGEGDGSAKGCLYARKDGETKWTGPYELPNSAVRPDQEHTSRTSNQDIWRKHGLLFLSYAVPNNFGTDTTQVHSFYAPRAPQILPRGGGGVEAWRSVMPSVIETPAGVFWCATRVSRYGDCGISLSFSLDNALTWRQYGAFETGNMNGNPPSTFYCPKYGAVTAFVHRKNCALRLATMSNSGGFDIIDLAQTLSEDAGYCQTFVIGDHVHVIYYTENPAARRGVIKQVVLQGHV
jgi:hypothetical protein